MNHVDDAIFSDQFFHQGPSSPSNFIHRVDFHNAYPNNVRFSSWDGAYAVQVVKKLKISGRRLCRCPANHLNCMAAKDWIKAQIGVWEVFYGGRDIRDRGIHPAVMPIALARRAVELFTHRGELVLDPFNGVGTTLVACDDLERNAVGFDINARYCEVAKTRLSQAKFDARTRQLVVCDDARNIQKYLEPDSLSLIFTSPPYANLLNRPRLNKSRRGDMRQNDQYLKIEQYSQDPRDLGTLAIEQYSEEMKAVYAKLLPLLRPGGHCVVNVPDMWWKSGRHGTRVPIHIHLHQALSDAGYEFRNTIIWDRTNIVNKVGIFGWPSNYITMGTTFEYLLDFWKPLQ
jgi:DNA modification methylase